MSYLEKYARQLGMLADLQHAYELERWGHTRDDVPHRGTKDGDMAAVLRDCIVAIDYAIDAHQALITTWRYHHEPLKEKA